jgi:hypothetical protein
VIEKQTRRGFALASAVCMLAAVGGIAAASFFATREAQRSASRLARQEEAASLADERLLAVVGAWDRAHFDSLAVGATDSVSGPAGDPQLTDAYVTRITTDVYSVAAVGRVAAGTSAEASRGHNLLVRLIRPTTVTRAALVSRGDVLVVPDATLSGSDRAPPGWAGCPPADSAQVPAVLVPEGRGVRDLAGQPLAGARVDSIAADSATYRSFGPARVAFLAERSNVALRAGAIVSPRPSPGDNCGSVDDIVSWGEPWRSTGSPRCEGYAPVIHASGDIVVTAGRGQGLLVVDGRLRIEGPFVFYGVIVAGGGVETTGTSVSIYGMVLSGSGNGVRWGASGRVQRSTCAVAYALAAAARPSMIGSWGWSELF